MLFLNPYFLYAALLTAIPVIIHLFNFRRFKVVYFSNFKFIEALNIETQKTSRLKHLLILLMRILVILCLVLAFAQPYIPANEKQKIILGKNNVVSVYIDNSFSMEALTAEGKLIDVARTKAKEIASAYNPSDLFQLLTNDFEGRHQRLVNKEEFLMLVDEVKISPQVKDISKIIRRQKDAISARPSINSISYLISDFQKNTTDLQHVKDDSLMRIFFIPLKSNTANNLFIDSCWFETPVRSVNHAIKIIARLKNHSDADLEKIPVKLFINGKQITSATANIKANTEIDLQLPYTIRQTGIQLGMLQIDDDPITYDDKFYFSFFVYDKIPILAINGKDESDRLNAVFTSDSACAFTNSPVKNLDYSSLNHYKLIILNELKDISSGLSQELHNYLDNGGSLIIFPAEEIDLDNYKHFLLSVSSPYYTRLDTSTTKINFINIKHPVYQNVFDRIPENVELPKVFKHYVLNSQTRSGEETLLKMLNGDNFLIQSAGKGKLFLFATPLSTGYSSMVKDFIFVPTIYQIALLSEKNTPLFYAIGQENPIEIETAAVANDDVFKMKLAESDYEFIPEHKTIQSHICIYSHDQINTAGNYQIIANGNPVNSAAFNYDRKESDLTCYDISTLKELIGKYQLNHSDVIETTHKPLKQMLSEINTGIKLWKLFILLALIFLALEIVFLRMNFPFGGTKKI